MKMISGYLRNFTHKKCVWIHKKTKLEFKKSDETHYGEQHWHASPKNGETGDYYNIDFKGKII